MLEVELKSQRDDERRRRSSQRQTVKYTDEALQEPELGWHELPYDMIVAQLRSSHGYLLQDEKRMGFTKKKRFDANKTKCMQTRINLKFPEMTLAS
jgi:hypothetical protein